MAATSLSACLAEIKANPGKSYVYILSRPCGTPFYVGVGTGRRITNHRQEACAGGRSHKTAVIRKIVRSGEFVRYNIVAWFDDWRDAAAEEVRLIALHGRADIGTGILANLTDGGEGAHGVKRSPETRALMSKLLTGRKFSDETLKRMSEGQRARAKAGGMPLDAMQSWVSTNVDQIAETQRQKWEDPEYRSRQLTALRGVPKCDGFAEANRQRQIEKFTDPEFRARWEEAHSAALASPEVRRKISEATKAKWADPEFRAKMMAARARSRAARVSK